jgi:hypothetical protein
MLPPYAEEITGDNQCGFRCNRSVLFMDRVSQNLCHKLFLGIPHPYFSKIVPINMGPTVNRFRDID